MQSNSRSSAKTSGVRGLSAKLKHRPAKADLYRRAEARLRNVRKGRELTNGARDSEVDSRRQLHELQVHRIELEMQNAELQEARERTEALLEKYTDLYDFAPVSYFTVGSDAHIRQVNLTGARLVGIERARLVGKSFRDLVSPPLRPVFNSFLKQVFAGQTKQSGDFVLSNEGQPERSVNIEARRSLDREECRAVVVDITERKRAEETQRRMEVLTASNQKLELEIVRRHTVEQSLKKSEKHQSRLLAQSLQMEEQLRQLSRQVLRVQEEERKRISRELHDVIAQTLTGINVRLANLKKEAVINTKGLDRNIARTQQMVEHAVNIVHRFARELRPSVLDDLGLIPALHTYVKNLQKETGIRVSLSAFAAVEQVSGDKRTVLYRVAQEALTNVARHAKASRVEVVIQKVDRAVCMEIKDNGRGFQGDRVLQAGRNKRLGLLGMKERLEMVGGSFTVTSAPGEGTTVRAQMPLDDVRPRAGGGAKTH